MRAQAIVDLRTRQRTDAWALFALADLLQAKEEAECREAKNRLILERIRRINPVMVRNVEASQP